MCCVTSVLTLSAQSPTLDVNSDYVAPKGTTIQYPGGGGGWSFCRGQIIYYNRACRGAENFTFYYMFI